MSAFPRICIVGAGFTGSVIAERIASDAGMPVLVIDRRRHIGGNSWSEIDAETGVEFHKYGSHIFHTSEQEVWKYISQFTRFNDYRHHVWSMCGGHVYAMPVNLSTINSFYGLALTPDEAREFITREAARDGRAEAANLEEKAVSLIGRPLYEAFIRGYTAKQWEKDPKELPPDIITRLPVRYTYDTRYFSDIWEGIPLDGYVGLFRKLSAHPLIEVRLGMDFADLRDSLSEAALIYTGAIDEYFGFRLGRLEWRTVDFEVERPACADFQGTAVMNYADPDIPHTRIHEFKHFHPERQDTGKTLIFREYSRWACKGDEAYYPVDTAANRRLYADYAALAAHEAPDVVFCGRLGQYAYMDMDDAVAAALHCYTNTVRPRLLDA
ncbi:MAG: UDP-galactopyranose mutase [Desulfovibrio sp.]|jgi:UDP-galactopyranose mutase|nr:UDP-galactopyranose mutase [Desulfovibrio sp.]